MKEITFLNKNAQKWMQYEQFVQKSKEVKIDTLADAYIVLLDDLSYAKTFYPNSKTVDYLDGLTAQIHQRLYKNKREPLARVWKFWIEEVPLTTRRYHKQLLMAFVLFSFMTLVGVISARYDDSFVNLILGDGYVSMTINNIENGDPMGVYKGDDEFMMFLGITTNNIRVAIFCFFLGIVPYLGVIFLFVKNGIMLGAFFYMFHDHNVLEDALYQVWLHGTLEIWAIVIGGTSGLVLGRGWLFPDSYSRRTSFLLRAKDGLKIVVGSIPLFFVAGFIEGYITRLTEMPKVINLIIIVGSLIFIVFYYVIYPIYLGKRLQVDVE